MLLMLEDNTERLDRFHRVMGELAPELPFHVWRNAFAMIAEAGELLEQTTLISLDHDLEPDETGTDPGDGYMVAQWLTAQAIIKPVVIHTSNGDRASWMAGEFDLSRWKHWRVIPFGDDWIEVDWKRTVRRLLKRFG